LNGWLEFLRPNHGREEIGEQKDGYASDDDVFHDGERLQGLTEVDVKAADRKESAQQGDVDDVGHEDDAFRDTNQAPVLGWMVVKAGARGVKDALRFAFLRVSEAFALGISKTRITVRVMGGTCLSLQSNH
jgi:hypothetical protein